MTYFDVFNGDADGICALHQFRMANPVESTLVTGVKRDIQLLQQFSSQSDDAISVFDISLDKNCDALKEHLSGGAKVIYFDHHFAGDIPEHADLNVQIDTSAETCTSVIVDTYLDGKYRDWAVVGAYGDGFDDLAARLASEIDLSEEQKANYKKLGILLNYNAYGSSVEDLHFSPADLYRAVSRFESPAEFMKSDVYKTLEAGYTEDNQFAQALKPALKTEKQAVYFLPNEKWARRISGVFANELNKKYPNRAHALLTDIGDDNYLVSIRAPASTKTGADELCRQFETGGGRKAAAGINKLPASDYDLFVERFEKQFS